MSCERASSIGVALDGIACASDGEPFYFSSLSDLHEDTLWILDVSPSDFYLNVPRGTTNFVHGHFLGEPLSAVAMRAGMGRTATDEMRVHALARIASRTITAAARLIDRQDVVPGAIKPTLADWVQSGLVDIEGSEVRQSLSEMFMRNVLKTIINAPTIPAGCSDNGAGRIFFSGVAHVDLIDSLIDFQVPSGIWREFSPDHFGSTVRRQVETIRFSARPVLVRCLVADVYEDLAPIVRQALRPGSRRWMTQHEFLFLSTFGTLAPERIFVCERSVALASLLHQPLRPLTGIERGSLSYGLASLSLLQALSTPVVHQDLYLSTSRAAWIASAYRLSVLRQFMSALQGQGACLLDYSPMGAFWSVDPSRQMRALGGNINGFDVLAEVI